MCFMKPKYPYKCHFDLRRGKKEGEGGGGGGGGGVVGVLYCTHISTFMYIDI